MNLYLPIHWGNSENNTAFRDISYICCYSGNSSAAVAPPPLSRRRQMCSCCVSL